MSHVRFAGAAALCAFTFLTFVPSTSVAETQRRRSLASCTKFEQRDKDDVTLELTVRSTCSMPIDCKVSWAVVCAPDSRKRRKISPGGASFTVSTDSAQATEASASSCGDDSWIIKDVSWRCEPSKD